MASLTTAPRSTSPRAAHRRRRAGSILAVLLLLATFASTNPGGAGATNEPGSSVDLDLTAVSDVAMRELSPATQELLGRTHWAQALSLTDDFASRVAQNPDQFAVRMHDGATVLFERTGIESAEPTSALWHGISADGDTATLNVVTDQDSGVHASVAIEYAGAIIGVRPDHAQHVLYELAESDFNANLYPGAPSDGLIDPSRTIDDAETSALAELTNLNRSHTAVIDLAIWYDNATVNWWGSDAAARNAIITSVNSTNVFFGQSGLNAPVRINLVGLNRVNYTGSGDDNTELQRITGTNDGHLDGVHSQRNALNADLVALITPIRGCGIAYVQTQAGGDASRGFSVIDQTCLGESSVTMAHEIGHNLGAHHDPANARNGAYFRNGLGYINQGAGFATIMAYLPNNGCCNYTGRFSNPNINFRGVAAGTASQYNARVVSANALVVSRYRVGPPSSPQAVAATAGSGQASVTWTAPSTDRGHPVTGYTVTASPSGRKCTTGSGGRRCTVTGLANGQRQTFSVVATNSQGTSGSANVSATPSGPTPTPTPAPTTPPNPPTPTPTTPTNGGTLALVTTSGNTAGWALVTQGSSTTKQWIDATCRRQLQNAGGSFTVASYNSFGNRSAATPPRSCDQLQALLPGGTGTASFVTTSGNTAGWALIGSAKQWINASCRQQLQNNGATFSTVSYNSFGNLPVAPTRTCNQLQSLIGGGRDAAGASFVTTTGNAAGWAVVNGTKQWLSISCRQQLQNQGATFTVVQYSSITALSATLPARTCAELSILV